MKGFYQIYRNSTEIPHFIQTLPYPWDRLFAKYLPLSSSGPQAASLLRLCLIYTNSVCYTTPLSSPVSLISRAATQALTAGGAKVAYARTLCAGN